MIVWNPSYRPFALNAFHVTVAHVIPEMVFPPEDLTFVDLQTDKTNMAQGIIPVCHTMP
jgi:hypothetical protein